MNVKKGIKFLSVFVAIVVLISSIFLGCNKNEETNNTSTNTKVEIDEHNQTGIEVDGVKISWANMKVDNEKLRLSDDQKTVLQYFDNDYFTLGDYEVLQRYPKIFRHLQVEVHALIIKMLEIDDEAYTCLAKLMTGIEESSEDVERNENYIVIRGPQPDSGRIVEGDYITLYGRYMDVEKHKIDGVESFYPTFNAFYYLPSYGKFDVQYIKKVAKIIFGQDIKLEDPMSSPDYELDENHYNGYLYYLVTLDNQTNANFSSFEFNRMYGYICDANYKDNIERNFAVSADFEHYIITVFDKNLNTIYLEYYDRDFKKIWSREFEDAESLKMDYTSETIYLTTNNDFYGIDISNGKDLFDSVYVGEKVRINIVDDGVVLVGTGNKDNIMKTDFKGNVTWKNSIDLEVATCSSLQIVDGNIIGFYMETTGDYRSVMVSVDNDGNIIEEFDVELGYVF